MIKYANQVIVKTFKGKKINVIIQDGKVFLGNTKTKSYQSLSGAAKKVVGYRIDGRTFFGKPKVAR